MLESEGTGIRWLLSGRYVVVIPSDYVLTKSLAWNSLSDLILTILPIIIIKKLNMEVRTRVVLCFILGLSFFAMIACIIKTIELKALGDRADFTYSTSNFVIWFTVEQYIVIIAASIPTVRPLALRLSQRWKNRSTPISSTPTVRPSPRSAQPGATHRSKNDVRSRQPQTDGSSSSKESHISEQGPSEEPRPVSGNAHRIGSALSWSSIAVSPRTVRLNTPTAPSRNESENCISAIPMTKLELEPPYIHQSPKSPPAAGTIRKTISIVISSESRDDVSNPPTGVQTVVVTGPVTPDPVMATLAKDSWPWGKDF
jgi:hypothetical protein